MDSKCRWSGDFSPCAAMSSACCGGLPSPVGLAAAEQFRYVEPPSGFDLPICSDPSVAAMQILLIYADPTFATSLGNFLERLGATVDYAATGRLGIRMASTCVFDAIVLAAELPTTDGFQACRILREIQGVVTPVMMLGRDTGVETTVAALEAGADDYRGQTAAFPEVYARLRALSRYRKATCALEIGNLMFDPVTEKVYREGKRLHPGPTGLKLLRVLMEAAPRLVTYAELEVRLWGKDSARMSEVNLRVQIHALRAVVDKPFDTPLIRTYRGVGYSMVDCLSLPACSS